MRTITRTLRAAALGTALLAGISTAPVFAEEKKAFHRLFDTEQLDNVKTGAALGYTHVRETHDAAKLPAIEDRLLTVAVGDTAEGKEARTVLLTVAEGERETTMDPFYDDSGNPVFVFFLESVAQAVAKSTGGSPFYIKNRIKDAFRRGGRTSEVELVRDGGKVTATRIAYRPFSEEKQRERLQNFDGFELAFLIADGVPGRLIEMRAADDPDVEGGFREYIVLDGMTEADP